MRKFEKISFEQFKKDIKDDRELYDSYQLPVRKTKASAGYDFLAIEGFEIKPGEVKKIPTGIKAIYPDDETLMLFVRSSMGFKWNVRMCNQVGIIDADFYNNPDNEGHMWFALQNHGDKTFKAKVAAVSQKLFAVSSLFVNRVIAPFPDETALCFLMGEEELHVIFQAAGAVTHGVSVFTKNKGFLFTIF